MTDIKKRELERLDKLSRKKGKGMASIKYKQKDLLKNNISDN